MFLLISLQIQSKVGAVAPGLAALAKAVLGQILPAAECSQLAAYLLLL